MVSLLAAPLPHPDAIPRLLPLPAPDFAYQRGQEPKDRRRLQWKIIFAIATVMTSAIAGCSLALYGGLFRRYQDNTAQTFLAGTFIRKALSKPARAPRLLFVGKD